MKFFTLNFWVYLFILIMLMAILLSGQAYAEDHEHQNGVIFVAEGYDTENGFKEDENCMTYRTQCKICGVVQSFGFCSWYSEEQPDTSVKEK